MERQGRRELLEVIEKQKEQLGRYESRLKDVVRAYKGLVKEKETLETTLKTITHATQPPEQKDDGGELSDVESVADSQASCDSASYKFKLGALSASLANISQEKASNETKYLNERRRFKKEKEELMLQISSLQDSEESLRLSFEEVKSNLIVEKHEREQETNNNHLMMKELQKLLSDERNEKEKLADQLLNKTSAEIIKQSNLDQAAETTPPHRLAELEFELVEVRGQLDRSTQQLREQNTTKQQLRQLEHQLLEVRQQHQEQLRSAELAREEAELRAIQIQQHQEHRVGNLESSLQDLSSSLAEYQRFRETDQFDICRLRQKIDSLSVENSELVRAVSVEPPTEAESDTKTLELEQIVKKVEFFKQSLVERGLESDVLEDLFSLPLHKDLRRQLVTAQDTIRDLQKVPSSPITNTGLYEDFLANSAQIAQLENTKAQNEILKTKMSELKSEIARMEQELNDKSLKHLELKQHGEREKEVVRMENRKQIGVLKFELQQQRERSLALLEEKDSEIMRLMGELEQRVEEAFYSTDRSKSASPLVLPSRKVSCDIGDMNSGQNSSGANLHYVQELSRKEVEIKELRALQFQNETTLRELQLNMSTKDEKYQERIEDLEFTVSRLERMTTAEGANLEYLKNVVLNYMLSTDNLSRNHMLKAIGAVLTLNKAEIRRVMEHNKGWWWRSQQNQHPAIKK